jgi:uncharacterized delta-60 repeat protein
MHLFRRHFVQSLLATLLACSASIVVTGSAQADPGELDPTFGGDGLARVSVTNASIFAGPANTTYVLSRRATRQQPDVAQSLLHRLTAEGQLDSTFDSDGSMVVDFGSTSREVDAEFIGVDDAGNVVLIARRPVAAPYPECSASTTYFDAVVVRVTAGGAMDTSFNGDGRADVPIQGGADTPACPGATSAMGTLLTSSAQQQIVVGVTSTSIEMEDTIFFRFTSDGYLDSSFGFLDYPSARGPEGTLVGLGPGGEYLQYLTDNGIALWFGQLKSDGEEVGGLGMEGDGGVPAPARSTPGYPNLLGTDGSVTTIGATSLSSPFALARIAPNATLDASYPTSGGTAPTFAGSLGGSLANVSIANDLSLVFAGYTFELDHPAWSNIGFGPGNWAYQTLLFVTSSGVPDTRYATDGRVLLPASFGLDAAIRTDGSVVQLVDTEGPGTGVVHICGIAACSGIDPAAIRRGTSGVDTIFGTYLRETIHAVGGADVIDGGAGGDSLLGGSGTDVVRGGAGFDEVLGGLGADRLFGGENGDVLDGNGGADRLWGNDGADFLTGGDGLDLLDGGNGNDRFFARDGKRDRIRCGEGRDTVIADLLDRVGDTCERVRRKQVVA